MPACKDSRILRLLFETETPETICIRNILGGSSGAKMKKGWVDDIHRPSAFICRSTFSYLHATSAIAARTVVEQSFLKGGAGLCNAATKFRRVIQRGGGKAVTKPVYMYMLDKPQLSLPSVDIGQLRPSDAALIHHHHTAYPLELRYIRERIRVAPTCAVRRNGVLVAWGLTHDSGAIGILYVHEKFRRQGMALSMLHVICRRLKARGITPFAHVFQDNSSSRSLFEKSGFTRCGPFQWFLLEK